MKKRRRNLQVFSLSFLDIICCGFGALVLLVLLSKKDVAAIVPDVSQIAELSNSVSVAQAMFNESEQHLSGLHGQVTVLASRVHIATEMAVISDSSLTELDREIDYYQNKIANLRQEMNTAVAQQKQMATSEEIANVGGIPVDREYVIFVIDTSGSMMSIWPRVLRQIEIILEVHPRVRGFQVINDNGHYLISSHARKWLTDTPARRKSVLKAMKNWSSISFSNPVPGIRSALRAYVKQRAQLSIYVLGDEYSESLHDAALEEITRLNADPVTGNPMARIHGIGFLNRRSSVNDQFSLLMREISRLNNGAFVAVAE